jgi:hypothetical protein
MKSFINTFFELKERGINTMTIEETKGGQKRQKYFQGHYKEENPAASQDTNYVNYIDFRMGFVRGSVAGRKKPRR